LGDVVIDGDDIHGDGVNVAARLEGLAEPGGVCVSAAVYDQVRDRIELRFEDLGKQRVKNIDRPVHVWRWVHDTVSSPPEVDQMKRPLPERPSIVVLPFNNLSRDPDQEYFSDGITEDIITDLSKVSGLFVIARNSAFVYKNKTFSVPHVCREVGVKFALEGSIRKVGNRVRVTAQLIDGLSGGHLWAERYDRDLTDIFEVQDDITQHIVAALKVTLSEAEKSLIVDGGTNDVNAHDSFLRGRELIYGLRRDREMFDQATACFRRAIEIDPTYAAAYAGLGLAYMLDYQNRWSDAPEASLNQAERFAGAAIAKDDQDPFAHYVASVVAMFKKDYERWAHEADKALSLNPNYALALNQRGTVHVYTGEPAKAIPLIEGRCASIRPSSSSTCTSLARPISWPAITRPRRLCSRIGSQSIRPRICRARSSPPPWATWANRKRRARFGASSRRSTRDTPTLSMWAVCHSGPRGCREVHRWPAQSGLDGVTAKKACSQYSRLPVAWRGHGRSGQMSGVMGGRGTNFR
jgi:adenylate cyclase